MKANEIHYFSDLFENFFTYFGYVHCPSSGHAVGICHASSVGVC